MTTTTALFLGFLQGLTEFLPVSSSGHLVIAEAWMGISQEAPLLFDLILHLATLIAVGIYFRARIANMWSVLWHWRKSGEEKRHEKDMIIAIFISTVITCVIGLVFKKLPVIDTMREQPVLVGWALIFTGIVLFSTYFRRGDKSRYEGFPVGMILFGVILGFAQGIATLPGVSRSGMTVCTALLLGSSKKIALEYSFIMSIPVILAASIFEMKDGIGAVPVMPALVGFMTSLLFGYIFLILLSWLTKHGKLYQFGFYTIPLGVWVLFNF
jgi:undecaprenyl-diphosphatase